VERRAEDDSSPERGSTTFPARQRAAGSGRAGGTLGFEAASRQRAEDRPEGRVREGTIRGLLSHTRLGRGPAAGRGRGAVSRWAAGARRRSSRTPSRGGPGSAKRAGAVGGAGLPQAGGAGQGAEGAGPRAGGGGGGGGGGGRGGGGGGGEHGGRGERLKCLFFRPGERESDAIRQALSSDGWTAASSASAACTLLLPQAEPATRSFCIPLQGEPPAPEEGAGEPRRRPAGPRGPGAEPKKRRRPRRYRHGRGRARRPGGRPTGGGR
jgi:hypothetical protein